MKSNQFLKFRIYRLSCENNYQTCKFNKMVNFKNISKICIGVKTRLRKLYIASSTQMQ
jgi:hypothetical protein